MISTLSWILHAPRALRETRKWGCAVGGNEKGPAVLSKQRDKRNEFEGWSSTRERQSETCFSKCRATAGQLHKENATEHKRQEAETPDHREARMEGWRAAQQERLAAETAEEREQNDRDGTVNALFRQKCWSFIVRLHHWVGHSSKFKVYISWTHMGIEITKANV